MTKSKIQSFETSLNAGIGHAEKAEADFNARVKENALHAFRFYAEDYMRTLHRLDIYRSYVGAIVHARTKMTEDGDATISRLRSAAHRELLNLSTSSKSSGQVTNLLDDARRFVLARVLEYLGELDDGYEMTTL